MSLLNRLAIGLFAGTLLAAAWGCDSKPTANTTAAASSHEEATVTGSVTIKGKKATGGTVTFEPTNENVPSRSATIEKDGTFSIKSLVGPNEVVVTAPGLSLRASEALKVTIEVAPGPNTHDIVLPPN
jgi:hypothetical protein